MDVSLRNAVTLSFLVFISSISLSIAQTPSVSIPIPETKVSSTPPSGDRITSATGLEASLLDSVAKATSKISPDYKVGVGDRLSLRVIGKTYLRYGASVVSGSDIGSSERQSPNPPLELTISPEGKLSLPLIGLLSADGKTVETLRSEIAKKLSAYYKDFSVELSIVSPAMVKVWVSGQVSSPGPVIVPSTTTVLEVLLRAGIQPTGSTRLVKLNRGNITKTIDLYSIVAGGQLENNVSLVAGDEIYVPAVTDWISVDGDVNRTGRFEAVKNGADSAGGCHVSDVMALCFGMLPTAEPTRAIIQRPMPGGGVQAIHVDLTSADNPELLPGDTLKIPSISDYQPTVRLVGEFKNDGIEEQGSDMLPSRSSVYRLAKGETAGDVIVSIGGTTPRADLRHAKIERRKNGKVQVIPLDLTAVMTGHDKSADVVLEGGDTVIVPSLIEKVYVFGQVVRSGGYGYEPDRRLLDYLAKAGGPAARAKSTVILVRGDLDKPEIVKVNLTRSMKGVDKDNPIVQPGDVIVVPEKIVTDWRDMSQIISTVRMLTLF